MVMISPCSGCDAPAFAHILAVFEMLSGIFTMIKTAWWFHMFSNSYLPRLEPESPQGDGEPASQTYRPDNDIESSTDSDSVSSEAIANNTLWTITGMIMGTLNFVLGGFLLVALTQVNYMLLVMWCIVFFIYYILDCISFTSLLKNFTTKDRFDRLKSQYIISAIISFICSSYILWVGISVIHWCNCRRDPYNCRFGRDYCHSFHLNFSTTGISSRDDQIHRDFDLENLDSVENQDFSVNGELFVNNKY